MAKSAVWQDDYWLPLMQIYLRKPVGTKPTYSRDIVGLSMDIHVAPHLLAARMKQIAQLSTPRIERIWQTYGENPRRLSRAVRLWREMRGFGTAGDFFDGIEVQETFERDFRPLQEDQQLTPVALILMLDLYYKLTPATMVAQTPEVIEMARLTGTTPQQVAEVLYVYQLCDPYLNRNDITLSPLLLPCQQIWERFADKSPEQVASFAEELKAFYK